MKAGKLLENIVKIFESLSPKEVSRETQQKEEEINEIAAQEQKQFSLESLRKATQDFHHKHKLGEGGFGPVYKGKLENGREVAVKRLSRESSQGRKEFTNEAKLLSRVQHRNVVNLVGYCAHGPHKLLVYEYVANESLDKILFKEERRCELDWKKRYDVIVGVARGLSYLHEDAHCRIIHRDIKASNILLDDKWVPKIADFGMARLYPEDQPQVKTRVAGTSGYMAPEYAMHGELSVKADVYSFGVLVLELISGRRNKTFHTELKAENLLQWVWKLYKKSQALEILDPTIASTAVTDQVSTCIQIGLLCTQADPNLRPTMRRVVVMLSKKPGTLDEPTRPGYPGTRYKSRQGPGSSVSGEHYSRATAASISGSTSDPNTATTSSPNLASSRPSDEQQGPIEG